MDNLEEVEASWQLSSVNSSSTSLPEMILQEKNELGTVIIFVVVAILAIMLLFVAAVFIDCRQEKLLKMPKDARPKRTFNFIPNFLRTIGEDEEVFADKMHLPDQHSGFV